MQARLDSGNTPYSEVQLTQAELEAILALHEQKYHPPGQPMPTIPELAEQLNAPPDELAELLMQVRSARHGNWKLPGKWIWFLIAPIVLIYSVSLIGGLIIARRAMPQAYVVEPQSPPVPAGFEIKVGRAHNDYAEAQAQGDSMTTLLSLESLKTKKELLIGQLTDVFAFNINREDSNSFPAGFEDRRIRHTIQGDVVVDPNDSPKEPLGYNLWVRIQGGDWYPIHVRVTSGNTKADVKAALEKFWPDLLADESAGQS